jgi:cell division protein ZapA
MANVEVEIGARRYTVTCRDGEEEHLLSVAAIVDRKAQDAEAAVGNLNEVRQLLFAALLLADEVKEQRSGRPRPAETATATATATSTQPDPRVPDALERLAERMERLAERLETEGATH